MTPISEYPLGRPASPSTARAINDRRALRLLQRKGPLTAAQLKAETGLSRPTVADLVERLRAAGLVEVVGETGAERRGPNAKVYGLVADLAHLAGVDVRTDRVTVVITDLLGRTLVEGSLPVDQPLEEDAAGIVAGAATLLERTAAEAGAARLHTVGLGAPGLVDPATGGLRPTGGPPTAWHGALVTELRARFDLPVLLDNEVNLAAVAEQRLGAATDRRTFVLVWLGHGVGAAVVLDGALRRGASGGAGEIGFLPVPGTSALPTATGCTGGLHSQVGSAAVCALAREHGLDPGPTAGDAAAAEAVVRAAVSADRSAADAFLDELAGRVAVGVAAVCAVLDPGCVVLGGEVGRAGGAELARRTADRLSRISPLTTEVRVGAMGGAAVLRGAVLTAMDAAQEAVFGSVD
ncbi:ROK family transcriptional regulator [Streptomyces sp. TP-A0874]|uniref:ROK family transcriptional regulator n=1 Tax=Streptomyces sp. TP-A0874 TaxID=549819 RepID=UPI000852CE6A|nr:ROK family transcriptional regulator [Streptomyces sp. TP-A0874]